MSVRVLDSPPLYARPVWVHRGINDVTTGRQTITLGNRVLPITMDSSAHENKSCILSPVTLEPQHIYFLHSPLLASYLLDLLHLMMIKAFFLNLLNTFSVHLYLKTIQSR